MPKSFRGTKSLSRSRFPTEVRAVQAKKLARLRSQEGVAPREPTGFEAASGIAMKAKKRGRS